MKYRPIYALMALAAALSGTSARADEPKEVKTESGKPVVLGNFLNAPPNCATVPGPIPLPKLREKPSHGVVGLQIVMSDVAASGACPERKVASIALFYTPAKDFVGKDSVQVEFETGETKLPTLGFVITVQAADSK